MDTVAHDPRHFTHAVTEFGARHEVVTTHPILNLQGVKILEQGSRVNPDLYERLMQHRLAAPLEQCVRSVPSVVPTSVQERVAQAIARVPLYERMVADSDTRNLLLDSMTRIPLPEAIAFQLTLASEMLPDLFDHLIDTALVSAWLALDPTHPSHARVMHAACVGLLHDLGMLHLDPVLLDYRQEIDEQLQRTLYTHPLLSHTLANNQNCYHHDILLGILNHHEFLDGSGYPRGLHAASLGDMARIVALAELVVGAYAPGRVVSEQRLSIVLRMNMHRYDETLAQRVLELLRPYPEIIGSTLPLLEHPAFHLQAVHRALAQWPLSGATQTGSMHHLADLSFMAEQIEQLQHSLARVGAAPEQLALIDTLEPDLMLQHELTLLVDEAAWQLRALARPGRTARAPTRAGGLAQVSGRHPSAGTGRTRLAGPCGQLRQRSHPTV